MLVKVLGSGCASCERLMDNAKQAVEELGIEATFEKVSDAIEIAKSGVMKTPGLIVDGKVLFSGRVPTVETIKKYIK
ncbi:thioredoxin family protein [Mycoplasmatota bacterium WC44]